VLKKKGIKFTPPNRLDDGFATKLTSTEADKLKSHTHTLCAPKTKKG